MRWLSYAENVMPSDAIDRTAILIDPFFEGEPSWITSGFRTGDKQLSIIVEKIAHHGIANQFPEYMENLGKPYTDGVKVDEKYYYWWQRAWSKLLNLGDIVNPPVPAECLFSYIRPGSKEDKKGQIIPTSRHQQGLAFDIGGGNNLSEKVKRVMHANQSGNCYIKSYLAERLNNCVHVDVMPI